MRHAVMAALLLLAACDGAPSNGFAVDVTVTANGSVPDATLAAVRTLDVTVSGAETFDRQYAISNQLASRQAKFIYRPAVASGTLDFSITAVDGNGTPLAFGEASVALESGGTVTLTVTLTNNIPPDMAELPDMAESPDMVCVPESDADFCARLGKSCETVSGTDNCGAPRTVASCGTCGSAAPACVANVCSVPVCGIKFAAGGTNVMSVSVANTQDDLLGSSASGDSLLLLRPNLTMCSPSTLYIADATTSGSMANYAISNINALAGFQKVEETMTLTADGLTIIGTDTTGKAFTTSTRGAVGTTTFGTAAVGPFVTINANIPAGGTLSWPVESADGLAFYYRVGGATNTAQNGIYESVRATTSDNFPAGTLMPAAVQMFDGVSGISSDRMTLFVEKTNATSIMTRNSLSQPFTVPTGAMPPGQAWRIVPIAGCAKLIGTCEPGGCSTEDVCTWAKM